MAKRRSRLLLRSEVIAKQGQDVGAIVIGCILLEHAVEAQAHEVAEFLLTPLIAAYQNGLQLALGWPVSVPRVIGLGHALLGQEAAARDFLNQAIASTEKAGARTELARARLDLAHLLAGNQEARLRAEARS